MKKAGSTHHRTKSRPGAVRNTSPSRRACSECGGPIPAGRKGRNGKPVLFCSDGHRKVFNNRRMIRGAVLFDEVMKWRYDREHSKAALTTMAQMASMFRGRDERLRGGRASWVDDPSRDPLTVASEVD